MTAASPTWLELHIDRTGADIQISARGSRGEQLTARPWRASPEVLTRFASSIQKHALQGRPLDSNVISDAQVLCSSLLEGEADTLLGKLQEAAQGPLLVRFFLHDSELRGLPWEALCHPAESLGFLGTSAKLLPVRGVMSTAPWQPREVRGAVRVLAIAPTGSAGLTNLKQALGERISSGEVEWLDQLEGPATKAMALFDRLRREPMPHVIHFLGHGRVANGIPELRLADIDDEETWIQVELLGQQLAPNFQSMLRLVVLEACEGAQPGALGSAAEILARAGADGVVAQLWPVKAETAQTCSTQFYRALAGANQTAGDIAFAMNEARRGILGAHGSSAEAFSPVLYLRGPHGQVFHFKGRKVSAPSAITTAVSNQPLGNVPTALSRIVPMPYSLVLGDQWTDDQSALDAFRERLQKELAKLSVTAPVGLPLSTLAQWFSLRRGAEKLDTEFQKVFRASTEAPAIIKAVAQMLGPGVHTTTLRSPWLEQAIAEQQPNRTIYVLQPSGEGVLALKREGGTEEWEELDGPPTDVDVDEQFIVLRPYRGYTTEQVFTRPLLTDDDYALHLRDLWNSSVLPADLANAILRTLNKRPALVVGLSLLVSNHRLLLHNLYARGVPRDTLAIVDASAGEGTLWSAGAGLPGRDEGVEAVETTIDALVAALEQLPIRGER